MTSPYEPSIPGDLPPGPRPMIAAVRARDGRADELRAAVAWIPVVTPTAEERTGPSSGAGPHGPHGPHRGGGGDHRFRFVRAG